MNATTIISILIAAQSSPAAPLDLVCIGGGAAIVNSGGGNAIINDNSGYSANVNVQNRSAVNYDDAVYFKLDGDIANIQMPSSLLPPIRGGDGGWFKVKKLSVSEKEILGKAAVNPFNNPQFRIDRITGTIQIKSKNGSFFGRCEPVTIANSKPKF